MGEQAGQGPRGATSSTIEAMCAIARRGGLNLTSEQLKRSFANLDQEPTTEALLGIAAELGLEAKKLVIGWASLSRLKPVTLPAILRLKDGRSLILERVIQSETSGQSIVLRDPSASGEGLVAVDQARLKGIWNGEIVLIKRRFEIMDDQQPFGFAWLRGQVLKERRIVLDLAVGALFSTFFRLAPIFAVRIIFDRVLANHSPSTLEVVLVALTILVAFEMALVYLRHIFVNIISSRIDGRINLYLLERLLSLPMDYFERNATGWILSKSRESYRIRRFMTGPLFTAFLDTIPLLIIIPLMFYLEWHLAIFVMVLGAIATSIVLAFLGPVGPLYRRVILSEHSKHAYLTESLYGMRTIKSLAIEGRRRAEWDRRIAESVAAYDALGGMTAYPETLIVPFERAMFVGPMILGAYLILSAPSSMSGGDLFAFILLSRLVAQPLIQVARLQHDVQEIRSAVREVSEIMNQPPEKGHSGMGSRLPIKGEVKFEKVQFRYTSDAPYALDDVTFTIPHGTMLGIMGRSGSGKTTVTRLLQGINTDYAGLIKLDGIELREIELDHLRTSIGVVPQENFLFSGTIRENIAMARPSATIMEITRAAQMAGAEEFIERMPKGYDTMLEEGAANLSGGQRQRLAIARALILEPPILVLDEATSALDAESETIINANLQKMAAGRTIICVSHRLSMLVPADAIMVLERGKVYDIGTHKELLQRCDIYRHLWQQQNRHVETGIPTSAVAVTA